VGKLVIAGSSTFTFGVSGSTLTIGSGSSGSQLIVTNGGTLFVDGTLTVGSSALASNNSAIFSGPTSRGTLTSAGFLRLAGTGGQLIVSNGAKISMVGSFLFGAASSFNTGVVVGAGSAVIADGSIQIGTGSQGGTNNFFRVSDGGLLSAGGTFAYGNNAFHVGDGIQIGGTGLMSTGLFTVVRSASNNTNHEDNFIIATNAFVSCYYLNPQGPRETISILRNATWMLTNSFSPLNTQAGTSNSVNVNATNTILMINGGTLSDILTADNGGGISIGGAGGNSLIVTNGGKLLTSMGTLGAGTTFNTGIVVGVGSVWSNFTGVAGFTNFLFVGSNTGGSNNFLTVYDGGTLYNDGTLSIGNNAIAPSNTVRFGGVGAISTIINNGSLNIGATTTNYGNILTVTNAILTCGTINVGNSGATNNLLEFRGGTINVNFVRVRPTNNVVFANGTLNIGAMTFDTLANNSNALVVGDGTSPAVYNMTNTGSGFHDFNNGGLVVTNGAKLQGDGTLEGDVTVLGTFAPGGSVGSVLASNNLSFGASAILNYDLGTLNSDFVTVKGNLALGGTVNVASSGSFGAGTYTLFTHTNTTTAPSGTLAVGTLPGGFSASVSNDVPNARVLLVVTATGGDPYSTWATFYGLTGGNGAGTNDPDGDGMSNTNEFRAGFNPTNSAAYLHVISVVKTNNDMRITYLGANGDSNGSLGPKTNILEFTKGAGPSGSYTNNFVSTGVTNILSGGTGVGIVTNMVDVGGGTNIPARYYRIRVLLP
jgi:hypothetical protein